MAIDRSKFKKTSASQLVQADKELNKTMGRKQQGNGHEIEENNNLFRIYPVHPDIAEKDPNAVFAVPFVQTFVPAMVQEKDKDGKVIMVGGKPKLKRSVRPVVNAKVHGGYPKDLIEEYISLANKNAKEMQLNKEERAEYLKPIYGVFSKDPNKNVNGINYPQVWIVYADKYPNANPAATPVFDELRIKKSIKERLNKISAIEAANDPLGTDPFTDIEEGRAIKIFKDSQAQPATNIYTTELDSSTVNEVIGNRTVKIQKAYPLSDAQLEYFLKQEPLQEKYGKKLATRKNFETQLAGLEILDNEWKMGVFDMPEWNQIVAEIDSYYPETNDTTPSNAQDDIADNEEEVVDQDGADQFDLMDRNELKQFAKDKKTGILVRPNMSDDEVRIKLRQWIIDSAPIEEEPFDKEQNGGHKVAEVHNETSDEKEAFVRELNGGKPVETPKVVEQPAATGTLSPKDRLAALRAKTAAGNAA